MSNLYDAAEQKITDIVLWRKKWTSDHSCGKKCILLPVTSPNVGLLSKLVSSRPRPDSSTQKAKIATNVM